MTDCCGSALRNDRLIQVFIGEESKPYLVQETPLTNLSDVFKRALENEDKFAGPKGVLKFPEDNKDAWASLLQWKITGKLPAKGAMNSQEQMNGLIHCYILSDKYNVKDFADEVMWLLIKLVSSYTPTTQQVKLAFENTPIGSPLRTLLVENVCFYIRNNDVGNSYMDDFDGLVGFTAELTKAMRESNNKLVRDRAENPKLREKFMVGDGPRSYSLN